MAANTLIYDTQQVLMDVTHYLGAISPFHTRPFHPWIQSEKWQNYQSKLDHVSIRLYHGGRGFNLILSQMTNFRLLRTESLQTTISNLMKTAKNIFQIRKKNSMKRRNCSLRSISPFSTVFLKELYCRHVKTRACLGKS